MQESIYVRLTEKKKIQENYITYEFAASLKPFSIAGIKFDGIACPIIMFSNSNLVGDPRGSGSMYLWSSNNNINKATKNNNNNLLFIIIILLVLLLYTQTTFIQSGSKWSRVKNIK